MWAAIDFGNSVYALHTQSPYEIQEVLFFFIKHEWPVCPMM